VTMPWRALPRCGWGAALVVLLLLLPGSGSARPTENELEEQLRKTLLQVEDRWLRARDAATLERILADDFVHPVPAGVFLNKEQHIAWFIRHLPPPGLAQRFENLRVRLYDAVGIVNGEVVASPAGGPARRTVFTDVFELRAGRWQAVNAQENAVEARPQPQR
jgi:hypothetical protein